MNTDTPTPETDAAAVFTSCNDSSDTSHPQGTHVATDFARKLERERDEAREQLDAERALADRLASELSDLWHNYSLWCDAYDDMEAMEAAIITWKEARRAVAEIQRDGCIAEREDKKS